MNFSISRNSSWTSQLVHVSDSGRGCFQQIIWVSEWKTTSSRLSGTSEWCKNVFWSCAMASFQKKESSLWWRHSAECMKWYWQFMTRYCSFSGTVSRIFQIGEILQLNRRIESILWTSHAPDSFKALSEHLTFSGSAFDSGLPYKYQLLAEPLGLP